MEKTLKIAAKIDFPEVPKSVTLAVTLGVHFGSLFGSPRLHHAPSGGPGDDFRRIKEGPEKHSFSDAPVSPTFPNMVRNMAW